MERYNLLLTDMAGSEGAIVMTPRNYGLLVAARPGFLHLNMGDFFSDTLPEEIGGKMHTALDQRRPGAVHLLSAKEFIGRQVFPQNPDVYLIEGRNGVRLNAPWIDVGSCDHCKRNNYEILALAALTPLFASKSEGSIQRQIREGMEELGKMRAEISMNLVPFLMAAYQKH